MADESPVAPFPSTTSFLLVAAGRRMQRDLEAGLAPLGLTLRHVGALGHLARRPDLSYSDLARRAGVTAQSMHATVRRLEALGAVQRRVEGQGRRAELEVTDHGRSLLREAAAVAARLDERIAPGIAADIETDALRGTLLGIAFGGEAFVEGSPPGA
jgi:DNA-binding MarR family transcriptional regulator